MTKANKKTDERNAINEALPSFLNRGKAVTALPKIPAGKKPSKASVDATVKRLAKEAVEGNKRLTRKAKAAEIVELKAVSGSVVPASFKAKAGKSGVMRQDDLDAAVRNAFLAAGSNDKTPQESARIACDEILAANGLDVGRWSGKNAGMLSMNLRNVLRGIRRNGESVLVGGKTLKAVTA